VKKRIFYVINLDRGRILTLSMLFGAFICVSFISGFQIGKNKSGMPLYSAQGDVSYLNENNYGLPILEKNPSETNSSIDSGKKLTRIGREISKEKDLSSSEEPEKEREIKENNKNNEIRKVQDKPVISKKKEKQLKNTARKEKTLKNQSKKKAKAEKKKETVSKSKVNTSSKSGKTLSVKQNDNPRSPLLNSLNTKLTSGDMKKSPSSVEKYSLQIGAFNNNETASRMKNQLVSEGFHAYIVKSGSQYKVRVGKSLNSDKLDKMESKLKTKKYASYRIKE